MSIFKCKMCGGTLEINDNQTTATCEYCGTEQTLPKLDDERRANLYDRANHFRRNNEFDKAMSIYENILNEDNTDSEAYWSLVLCRYGIEYVEDPATHLRVPTVNRAQFTSIFDDSNYKSALQYADIFQKSIYEAEAKAINEIQKGILAISQKEEPFDVFICYKETDSNGRRTQDSVLANDLYHLLTAEGFKVFFSRITLEDKLGVAYEPYIFAALNSAKVMVVLGTKPEYFNAVWVKNEWSRYLSLVKNSNGKKVLIPAYKDMDPYDLPDEFSHLQAQDMSKLGFMQDLIRGIKKLAANNEAIQHVKETIVANSSNTNVTPLLKRAFMFLEDGEFQKADGFCEQVLNQDPENAEAYLGKLMAELGCKKRENLKNCKVPLKDNNNYQKAIRFGDAQLKAELDNYISHILARIEQERLNGIYDNAIDGMQNSTTEEDFKKIAEEFKSIIEFKDSKSKYDKCLEKAEMAKKHTIYKSAKAEKEKDTIESLENAIDLCKSIPNWNDSDKLIISCQNRIEGIKLENERKRIEAEQKAEKEKRKKENNRRFLIVAFSAFIVCIVLLTVLNFIVLPNIKYNNAINLFNNQDYIKAYEIFLELGDYKDSIEKRNISQLYGCKVGSEVTFGNYEQNNKSSDGKEEIQWIVLKKEKDKLLVISKHCLDCKQYHSSYSEVTWETSTLRQWLNTTFLDSAFSDVEQEKIVSSKTTNGNGSQTFDKVFLLSVDDANKYFESKSARQAKSTDYAKAQGAYVNNDTENSYWWLQTEGNGYYRYVSSVVNLSGDVYVESVNSRSNAVRPAMWIDF